MNLGVNANTPYGAYLQSHGNRGFDWRYPALALGAPLGGAALQAMFTGAGAAAGAAGAGSVNGLPVTPLASSVPMHAASGVATATLPKATSTLGPRLATMFNSKGMDLGVNAGLSLLSMRSQNKANDQARADALAAQREALALQRQQLEQTAMNANLDREDARAANAALNELKKRELDAAEEERAFNRSIVEQREARLAPYRQRGTQALDRLAAMWSLG